MLSLIHIEAKYDSASGMYSIRWELSDKEHVTITMDVPFDCTAEAVLPMVAKSEKEAVAEVLGSEENLSLIHIWKKWRRCRD